jgi:hypothetical protein
MSRTSTRDRLMPGTRIGEYRIELEIRNEETGVIYGAVHLVLPRRAAIKVMHPGPSSKAFAVKLLREACILEALSHPGVPRVYECGVLGDKRPWVALELVDGVVLSDAIQAGPMPTADLVGVIRGLAEILEHAHARGVRHHCISEAVVTRTPQRVFPVCLSGWGEVAVHDSEHAVDPSVDIHALGTLAFRALAGSLVTPTASAQEHCPGAPAELTRLIDEMLAPDPEARPRAADIRTRATWIPLRDVAPARAASSDFKVRIKS